MSIVAVTCMRNDGPYCLEWIAHHQAAGVGHFVILTHECDDGTGALLDALPDVTHVPFEREKGKSVQWQAMRLADRHELVKGADWVLFFDSDEFLCLEPGIDGLAGLIAQAPGGVDAIALPWRLFGSGGAMSRAEGITPRRFTRAAPWNVHLPAAHFFKTLYRPRAFQKMGVHRPKRRKTEAPCWSVAGGAELPEGFAVHDARINLYGLGDLGAKAWLNHYSLRSAEEFMVKRQRGLPNRTGKALDLGYWAERNFNTVEDRAIERMLPATEARLAALMALPGVAALHETCVTAHRRKFEELMADEDQVRFLWHLELLGGSVAPRAEMTRAHLMRLAKVRNG